MNQFSYRNLKKNRVRTLVTILGIILSTALFTAVLEGLISTEAFLVDFTVETEGAWEIYASKVPGEKAEETGKIKGIKDIMVMQGLGYHKLENTKNPNKPYLTIMQIEKNSATAFR